MKWFLMVLELVLEVLSAMDNAPQAKQSNTLSKEEARNKGIWLPSDFYP